MLVLGRGLVESTVMGRNQNVIWDMREGTLMLRIPATLISQLFASPSTMKLTWNFVPKAPCKESLLDTPTGPPESSYVPSGPGEPLF